MPLYERYELLELRRDDGVQTFHARDIETARPVQLHMFAATPSDADRALLARLDHLPEAERRRVIERGDYQGRTFVVTDRLAGYAGFREWLTTKTDPTPRQAALNDQFFQLFDPNAETATFVRPVVESKPPIEQERAMRGAAAEMATPDRRQAPDRRQTVDRRQSAAATAVSPIAPHPEPPLPVAPMPPVSDSDLRSGVQKTPNVGKSLLGIVLGILAAIGLLFILVAAYAFRPR